MIVAREHRHHKFAASCATYAAHAGDLERPSPPGLDRTARGARARRCYFNVAYPGSTSGR